MTAKQSSELTLASWAGLILMMGSIGAPAFVPQLPIWGGILLGILIGAPLLIMGMHQSSQLQRTTTTELIADKSHATEQAKNFWPTRAELWKVMAGLTFFAALLLPYLLFIAVVLLIPAGDNWPIVILRLASVGLCIGGALWWFTFARKTFPKYFRGKISNETLDAFLKHKPTEEPKGIRAAALRNWSLPLIATLATLVAIGIIDLRHPAFQIDQAPRRTRGIVKILVWCRGNPNTVRSSAGLVAVAALAFYGTRIRRAQLLLSDSVVDRSAIKTS